MDKEKRTQVTLRVSDATQMVAICTIVFFLMLGAVYYLLGHEATTIFFFPKAPTEYISSRRTGLTQPTTELSYRWSTMKNRM